MRLKPEASGDPLEAIQAIYSELKLAPRKLTIYESPRGAMIDLEFAHRQAGDLMQLVQRLRALPMVRAIRTEVIASKGDVTLPKRSR